MKNIIGLNEDNYRGIGYLMFLGFVQDSEGRWCLNTDEDTEEVIIKDEYNLVKDGKFVVEFGNVDAIFNCDRLNLTSLIGAPTKCLIFRASYNNIEVLDYVPEANTYNLSYNKISSITYKFPNYIDNLFINSNKLSNFDNFPKSINTLQISNCEFKDLTNCPEILTSLNVSTNKLTSLIGSENNTLLYFDISDNIISNLDYCPNIIMTLRASRTNIKNLKGLKGFCAENINLDNCENLESLYSENVIKTKTLNISRSSIKSFSNIGKEVKYIRAIKCNNLIDVYIEDAKNKNIRISGDNICMYSYSKVNYNKDTIVNKTKNQERQLFFIKYGNDINFKDIDKNTYYDKLFEYSIRHHETRKAETVDMLKDLIWDDTVDNIDNIKSFIKSYLVVDKFKL